MPRPSGRGAYIIRRPGSINYQVKYQVPKQDRFPGCPAHVTKTTGTSDLKLAERLKYSIIADIQQGLARQRDEALRVRRSPLDLLDGLRQEALAKRARVELGSLPQLEAERWWAVERYEAEWLLEEAYGDPSGGDAAVEDGSWLDEVADPATPEALEFSEAVQKLHLIDGIISGEQEPIRETFAQLVERRLDSGRQAGLAPATILRKKAALSLAMAYFGHDADPLAIRRPEARRFAQTNLIANQEWTLATKESYLQQIKEFFSWLEQEDEEFKNPFAKVRVSEGAAGRRVVDRVFTNDELCRLILSDWPSLHLSASFLIGLYSGLRLEEIYGQQVRSMSDDGVLCFYVDMDAKTQNSVRRVPCHPVIEPLVRKLMTTSFDGYLISGLKRSGGDRGRRGHHVSGVFADWRRSLGIPDGKTFHSTRHTFISAMRDAGLTEAQAASISGHKSQTVIAGYMGRPDLARLVEWVAMVTYRDGVDDLARRLVEAHPGNPHKNKVRATARTPVASLIAQPSRP